MDNITKIPTSPNNFIFHKSFYDTYLHLRKKSKETALLYLDSIFEYAFNNITPNENSPISIYAGFPAIQFQIDLDKGRITS